MNKLKELIEATKAGLSIEINNHKNVYEPVEKYLELHKERIQEDFGQEIWDKMIETDTIVYLHFYKDTPIGFLHCYHYDFDEAVNMMYEWYFN